MTPAAPEPTGAALGAGLEPGAQRLLKLAVAALARREHSRVELERKLAQALQPEDDPQDVVRVSERLLARGLLSDRRMAEALVRTRAPRYGRLRLAQELGRRGVDRDTIAALLPLPEDDQATATALWRRKFGRPPANLQERARQARFLAARGFTASVIGRVLSSPED